MAVSRKPLRRLVIDGATYLWKVEHEHVAPAPEREGRCREVFSAFLEGKKRSPLRVWFSNTEHNNAGYPDAGVVWIWSDVPPTPQRPRCQANLNEPGVARRLIDLAIAGGWRPETLTKPFVIEDGFAILPRLAGG